jgi:hypothetical protein
MYRDQTFTMWFKKAHENFTQMDFLHTNGERLLTCCDFLWGTTYSVVRSRAFLAEYKDNPLLQICVGKR